MNTWFAWGIWAGSVCIIIYAINAFLVFERWFKGVSPWRDLRSWHRNIGRLRFCVITELPQINFVDDEEEMYPGVYDELVVKHGNVLFVGCGDLGICEPVVDTAKVPAFQLGEILVVEANGIEIGPQRKPHKFGVGYEIFSDIFKAVERSEEISHIVRRKRPSN